MHMKGTPQTMQSLTNYEDIVKEMTYYFSERINKARSFGLNDIVIDPGLDTYGRLVLYGLRAKPYDERFMNLRLLTMGKRRLRGDMIQIFKYLNKLSNVDHSKLFQLQSNMRTRNNGLPLQERRCSTYIGWIFCLKPSYSPLEQSSGENNQLLQKSH